MVALLCYNENGTEMKLEDCGDTRKKIPLMSKKGDRGGKRLLTGIILSTTSSSHISARYKLKTKNILRLT